MRWFALMVIFMVLAVVNSIAATLPRDGDGLKLQAPSWDATLSQAILSTTSQNITISGRIWYEFVASGDCKGRLMNTTTRANWPQFTLKASVPFRGSNDSLSTRAKAAYLNLSGCTGDYRAQ